MSVLQLLLCGLSLTAKVSPPPLTFAEYMARRDVKSAPLLTTENLAPHSHRPFDDARSSGAAALTLRDARRRALSGHIAVARRARLTDQLPGALLRIKLANLAEEGAAAIALRAEREARLPEAMVGLSMVNLKSECERSMLQLDGVRVEANRLVKLLMLAREGKARSDWLQSRLGNMPGSAASGFGPPPDGFVWAGRIL